MQYFTNPIKLLLFLCLLLSLNTFAQKNTEIYFVRHAEKIISEDKNPGLTEKGKKRAADLEKIFQKIHLDAIFTTNTIRTIDTQKAIAANKNITPQFYKGNDWTELAEKIKKEYLHKKVLIVGHSNTILETIEAFGTPKPFDKINDNEYNNLFKMVIHRNGAIELFVEHFGDKNDAIPVSNTMK